MEVFPSKRVWTQTSNKSAAANLWRHYMKHVRNVPPDAPREVAAGIDDVIAYARRAHEIAEIAQTGGPTLRYGWRPGWDPVFGANLLEHGVLLQSGEFVV